MSHGYGHSNYPGPQHTTHISSLRGGAGGGGSTGGSSGYYQQPAPAPPPPPERWPYFLEGADIAREVIRSDLPRYLGNDCAVRPGVNPATGENGYLYRGFRQLTNAQIQSLKEDSTKWHNEREHYYRTYRREGPEYSNSATLQSSTASNPHGHNPSSMPHAKMPSPQRPSIPEVPVQQQPQAPPRYLYMPLPDGRPWFDNHLGQYVLPFRPPESSNPSPAVDVPRGMALQNPPVDHLSTVRPSPLDRATGLPYLGYWGRGEDGSPVFYRTT